MGNSFPEFIPGNTNTNTNTNTTTTTTTITLSQVLRCVDEIIHGRVPQTTGALFSRNRRNAGGGDSVGFFLQVIHFFSIILTVS